MGKAHKKALPKLWRGSASHLILESVSNLFQITVKTTDAKTLVPEVMYLPTQVRHPPH